MDFGECDQKMWSSLYYVMSGEALASADFRLSHSTGLGVSRLWGNTSYWPNRSRWLGDMAGHVSSKEVFSSSIERSTGSFISHCIAPFLLTPRYAVIQVHLITPTSGNQMGLIYCMSARDTKGCWNEVYLEVQRYQREHKSFQILHQVVEDSQALRIF